MQYTKTVHLSKLFFMTFVGRDELFDDGYYYDVLEEVRRTLVGGDKSYRWRWRRRFVDGILFSQDHNEVYRVKFGRSDG